MALSVTLASPTALIFLYSYVFIYYNIGLNIFYSAMKYEKRIRCGSKCNITLSKLVTLIGLIPLLLTTITMVTNRVYV